MPNVQDEVFNIFSEIHSDLPREGPGDNQSTRKAFSLMRDLPPHPHILDIGCGPGMHTLELAQHSDAKLTALDIQQSFLDEVERRAEAAGLSERITTVRGSMDDLPFNAESFDAIWSEGAIYIMGFENGLRHWRSFLKSGGCMAITEICWLKNDLPEEPKRFWTEGYPDITTVDRRLASIKDCGYKNIAHFTIPESAWWADYYNPIEKKLALLKDKYKHNPSALNGIADAQQEIDLYRKYADCYGYIFFVMQK